jgi:hypothetical protein
MTAIIIKFKPTIFDDELVNSADGNIEDQKSSTKKRLCEENEATAAPEKKAKLDDDLTSASVVDTSTA